MKNFLGIISLFLGLVSMSFISYANQQGMNTYYPSPMGNYAKLQLINPQGQGGPDANDPTKPFCLQTANGYDAKPNTPGSTYINAGTIFADPNTGYLEVCKSDGTFASYPGSCFNRYAPVGTPPQCPNNYLLGSSQNFSFIPGNPLVSWSCCFTGQGNNQQAAITKSGCFSIFSNSPNKPAFCNDPPAGDPNAYDISCNTLTSADMTFPVYQRSCCFNAANLGYTLGQNSPCS